jgi:hypothetical protein
MGTAQFSMLQLLPALIFLFIQGPATLDRAVLCERFPEVLQVLAEATPDEDEDGSGSSSIAARRVALASLAVLSERGPELVRVMQALWAKSVRPVSDDLALLEAPKVFDEPKFCLDEAHSKSQRSRDGPVSG